MAKLSRYEDVFWDRDCISTAGFDALVKRGKEGRNTMQEVEDFVKTRAKLEEEYGKGLIKLSKVAASRDEIGTLRTSWDTLRQHTEVIGKLHIDMSAALCELGTRLSHMITGVTEQRRKVSETIKKLQASKSDQYRKTVSCQRAYNQKYDIHDQAQLAYQLEKGKSGYSVPKEIEKLESKMLKTKDEMTKADAQYRSCVEALEVTRIEWEKEMERACQAFQKMDRERIEMLRNEMWVLVNLDSETCFEQDQANDGIRAALETCSMDADIQLFIDTRQTGSERPAAVLYESCEASSNDAPGAFPTMPGPFPVSPAPGFSRQPLKLPQPTSTTHGIYEDVDSVRGNPYSFADDCS